MFSLLHGLYLLLVFTFKGSLLGLELLLLLIQLLLYLLSLFVFLLLSCFEVGRIKVKACLIVLLNHGLCVLVLRADERFGHPITELAHRELKHKECIDSDEDPVEVLEIL